ncbi:MAG: hypothetical protein K2H90_03475 [Oscillospiraceae bacterium]|nr:hypothetical protein [Oscillospiraceae bacterium]
MAYADYDFYKDVYRGTLSEADFLRLAERASDYIDGRTEYILKSAGISEDMRLRVKKACCAVAETIRDNERGVKTSEKVGNYSATFGTVTQRSAEQRLDDTVQLYLADLIKGVKWI